MTVRMLLPFNMGKVTYLNPISYEETIDHPVLDIGSSFVNIKQPVCKWLVDNFDENCRWGFDGKEYYIDFPSEKEKVMFILKWWS